jgi:hypothetical protein
MMHEAKPIRSPSNLLSCFAYGQICLHNDMSKNEKPFPSVSTAVTTPSDVDAVQVMPRLRVTQNNLSFLKSI